MTDLATIIDHARLTDLERSILRAILPAGCIGGTSQELADAQDVSPRSLFRALGSLERRGLIMRSAKRGRSGSMLITLNGDVLTKLRAMCHNLGRENERPGAEYTPVCKEDEEAVRADRARLLNAKRARQSAALGNACGRSK